MSENIMMFPGITPNNYEPDYIIDRARGKLDMVVIIGYTPDNDIYFSSSHSDGGSIIWLLENAKKQLLEV
jgi:hypothetical protein